MPSAATTPDASARRLYAIGDVHGRYDLFRQLIDLIRRDQTARPPMTTRIVLLGNIVDKGPDSARMVRACMKATEFGDQFLVLKGNHEDLMTEALSGNPVVYGNWLRFGGRQTLLSWGVDRKVVDGLATMDNLRIAANTVGRDVIEWLANLPLYYRQGDHLFVHAGIRPGIALAKQEPDDLLWIKDEFLKSTRLHGPTVVHGHSVTESGPDFQSNRIGIDTGAYRTGRLTALGVENDKTWALTTIPARALRPSKQEAVSISVDRRNDGDRFNIFLAKILSCDSEDVQTSPSHEQTVAVAQASRRLHMSRTGTATIAASLLLMLFGGTMLSFRGKVPAERPGPVTIGKPIDRAAPPTPRHAIRGNATLGPSASNSITAPAERGAAANLPRDLATKSNSRRSMQAGTTRVLSSPAANARPSSLPDALVEADLPTGGTENIVVAAPTLPPVPTATAALAQPEPATVGSTVLASTTLPTIETRRARRDSIDAMRALRRQ